jgi:hypothetical protein
MFKKMASVLIGVVFLTAPAWAQTTPAPVSPSVEPSTPAAPAKTAMKKKAKHPAKKAARHAKPKAPAEAQPAGSDQD